MCFIWSASCQIGRSTTRERPTKARWCVPEPPVVMLSSSSSVRSGTLSTSRYSFSRSCLDDVLRSSSAPVPSHTPRDERDDDDPALVRPFEQQLGVGDLAAA
jgi:hypothetical protein